MAQVDPERGRLALRIVYDGPAFAGKTTTARSLGRLLGREVFASETAEGRTLHFDWLDYEAGRYEGYPLYCQIVTVPGQPEFKARRQLLLDEADAIVFVVDSRSRELGAGLAALEELREWLASRPRPRPGVLVQANWRDAPDAVALEDVRRSLALGDTVGVVESVATDGTGIRQAFVLAVRLALDRVAHLIQADSLIRSASVVTSGPELLAAFEAAGEKPVLSKVTPPLEPAVPTPGGHRAPLSEPVLPTAELPVGRIWPPVEGRVILHEAEGHKVEVERRPSGDWAAQNGRWYFHSAIASVFFREEDARAALLAWARWHATTQAVLSPARCLCLVEHADRSWRLWQVIRAEQSLARALDTTLRERQAPEIVRDLLESARLLEAARVPLGEARLPVSLETVGLVGAQPVYVGVVPSFEFIQRLQQQPPPTHLEFGRLYRTLFERTGLGTSPERHAVIEGLLERANSPELADAALSLVSLLSPEH